MEKQVYRSMSNRAREFARDYLAREDFVILGRNVSRCAF